MAKCSLQMHKYHRMSVYLNCNQGHLFCFMGTFPCSQESLLLLEYWSDFNNIRLIGFGYDCLCWNRSSVFSPSLSLHRFSIFISHSFCTLSSQLVFFSSLSIPCPVLDDYQVDPYSKAVMVHLGKFFFPIKWPLTHCFIVNR